MRARWIVILLGLLTCGCAGGVNTNVPDAIILVCGAGGDGPWYDGVRSISTEQLPVQTFSWGVPLPLYMLNLQDTNIHAAAEEKLAGILQEFRNKHPAGRLDLIGHSAGCGVALGALARLPKGMKVDRVILLAPSVSPEYDLGPALEHLTPPLEVFYSDRDKLWLSWRTSTFGTYDNVKTQAAGHTGFRLKEDQAGRVAQHGYDADWEKLGNDGGHDGTLAREFEQKVIAPMLR